MVRKLSLTAKILITLVSIPVVIALIVGIYFAYVFGTFYRIQDNIPLEISGNRKVTEVSSNAPYRISTWNIGFGAYDDSYDFFMDDGYADTERKELIHGTHARAIDKKHVLQNTNGVVDIIKVLNPDFAFFQEVDTKSTRSYKVNQVEILTNSFKDFAYTNAINYHSAYLCYPLNEPIGKSISGLVTISFASPESSLRRSLPLSDSKMANIIDLDRCIMINRYKVENSDKELVLINVHMSAYDKGGLIRKKQVALLGDILSTEKQKENYIIVGGDFNQILIPEGTEYFIKPNGGEVTPNWVALWDSHYDGYKLVATKTGDTKDFIGTARNNTKPYDPNWTYTCVIDGFIVSENIAVEKIENITSHAFKYSDHNPVIMDFILQ